MSRAPFRGDEQLLGNQCGPEPHLWEMSQNLCCSIPSLGSHRQAEPASLRLSGGWALGWSLSQRVEALLNIYLLCLRSQVVGSRTGAVSGLTPHPFPTPHVECLVLSLSPGWERCWCFLKDWAGISNAPLMAVWTVAALQEVMSVMSALLTSITNDSY